MQKLAPKDPRDQVYRTIDTTSIIGSTDTVADADWTIPIGLTLLDESISGRQLTIKLDGGTAGEAYELGLEFTTTTTQERFNRTLSLTVKEL